jgi:hypothetical protein
MKTGQIIAAAGVVVLLTSGAWAISGRALAVGRAFQYGYNNPQQEVGYGPRGSSMYWTSAPPTVGGGGYGGIDAMVYANNPGASSTLNSSMRSSSVYAPVAPMTIVPQGGGGAFIPAAQGSANPFVESISVLQTKTGEGTPFSGNWLTSLAPPAPGVLRQPIEQGQGAMKAGNYKEAFAHFDAARKLADDLPDTLLSLSHASLAMGEYDKAAGFLVQTLQKFPDLPLVQVRPKEFFPAPADYEKALAGLQDFVKANPTDAAAKFLLGYLQYRDGYIDQGMDTFDEVMDASPSKDLAAAVSAMLDGIARTGHSIFTQAPPLERARDYAWAGIRLALPMGFQGNTLTSPNQVLAGMVTTQKPAGVQLVTLNAYPLGETITLEACMNAVAAAMEKARFVKDMKVETEVEVPFQTGKALVRVFTYTPAGGGNRIATAWVGFIQEPRDKKGPRMGYLLGVAGAEKQSAMLLPTLVAIAKSVALSEPAVPSMTELPSQGSVFTDAQFGFSIFHPAGWSARQTPKGLEMGQMDFADGVVSPKVDVYVMTIPATYTAETYGDEVSQRKSPQGLVRTLLSKQPAKLAGQDGYEFVLRQGPEKGDAKDASILVGRLVCVDKKADTQTLYAVVVEGRAADEKDVQTFTQKIADTFRILPPAATPEARK